MNDLVKNDLLFLCLIFSVFLLSGCGGSGGSDNSNDRTVQGDFDGSYHNSSYDSSGLDSDEPNKQSTPNNEALSRYALANGCYAIQSNANQQFIAVSLVSTDYHADEVQPHHGEPFFLKATGLGRYLLMDTAERVLSFSDTNGTPVIVQMEDITDGAEWDIEVVDGAYLLSSVLVDQQLSVDSEDGRLTLTNTSLNTSRSLKTSNTLNSLNTINSLNNNRANQFQFIPAEGCIEYPEAELNVEGNVLVDDDPDSPVWGIADSHIHITAYEFIGGRINHGAPFHRFGLPHALDDCMPIHGPFGSTAIMESVLSFDTLFTTHETRGYPTFNDWPKSNSTTHHQTYYRWIERTYKAGVRLLVNQLVANETLCELYPYRDYGCDEMESVDLQLQRIHEMQDYIDAQHGGPGKGWFRIVSSPEDARTVIKSGKLAVLLGIESSELFGCHSKQGEEGCTRESIDASLDKYYDLGVRSFFPVHEFDNSIGGSGLFKPSEIFLNIGNRVNTGHYYDVEECPEEEYDHKQPSFFPSSDASPMKEILQFFGNLVSSILPSYDQSLASHCNTRGISELGEYMIQRMMDKGVIIETDHMSAKMRNQVLTMAEIRGYSGLISGHSSSGGRTTETQTIRLRDLGGLIYPLPKGAEIYADDIRRLTAIMLEGEYHVGIGFGSDVNGFAHLPKVREGNESNPVEYPFTSFDGRFEIDRQVTGERIFDINTDGVAHYGLYPDFIEDMRKTGLTDEEMAPLFQSAEAYLQMWERAAASTEQ